jgi:phosphoenolpyruvate phosphomutase
MLIHSATNDVRRGQLRALIGTKRCLRVMEVHSPISAIIAENAYALDPSGRGVEFDAFWSSSLTDSTSRGLPDIEVLDPRSRLANIDGIFSVTTKSLIMDGDTGGRPEHFEIGVRDMERHGVSAVIIEDKCGLKQNSLLGVSVGQMLAPVEEFCDKISRGKAAQVTDDFLIFARLESLILGAGMADALYRADAYLDAGADGIMIHSRQSKGDEVLAFASAFRERHPHVPLVAVPTTYHTLRLDELEAAGFNVIIYANHMLRAAIKAMRGVCQTILENGRTTEAEEWCSDLDEVLRMSRVRVGKPAEVIPTPAA